MDTAPLDWLKASVQRERGYYFRRLQQSSDQGGQHDPGSSPTAATETLGVDALTSLSSDPSFQGKQYSSRTPKGQGSWRLQAWTLA